MIYKRSRTLYMFLILAVIFLGLASRRFSNVLPSWIGSYVGDILWALMVFFIFGFIFKSKSTFMIALGSIILSSIIEASQLYHSQWIDSLRSTRLGGLVLGFGFLWSDLICYTIGICMGILFEMLIIRNKVIKKG